MYITKEMTRDDLVTELLKTNREKEEYQNRCNVLNESLVSYHNENERLRKQLDYFENKLTLCIAEMKRAMGKDLNTKEHELLILEYGKSDIAWVNAVRQFIKKGE